MRHSAWPLWLFPLVFPLVMVCSPSPGTPTGMGDLGQGMKVLFIGNSLTAFNNLPERVQIIAEAAGHELAVRSVVGMGYSLEDHWEKGEALRAIRSARWDVVVLQQGPSSLALNQVHLREWTSRFDAVIREQSARPALYMVWPEAAQPGSWNAVSDAYTRAAEAVAGMLFPVGEAWRAAWSRDPTLELYSGDGFHPSELGSSLAALVIFQQLFGESPVGLPHRMVPATKGLPTLTIPSELAPILQEAAAEANDTFGIR